MPDPYPDVTDLALQDDGEVRECRDRASREVQIAYNYNLAGANIFGANGLTTKYGEIRAEWKRDRLWLVSATAETVLGVSQVNGVVVAPSSSAWGGTLPAGEAWSRNSMLAMRVVASGSRGTVIFDMDPTGPPVEVWAKTVTAYILAPDASEEITPSNPAPVITGNVGANERLTLSIEGIRTSRGNIETRRTIPLWVPANTVGSIIIPPYAHEVVVYQDNLGIASVNWDLWYGQNPAGRYCGPVPFPAGNRRSEPTLLQPGVHTLSSDNDVANARFFSAMFKVRPP